MKYYCDYCNTTLNTSYEDLSGENCQCCQSGHLHELPDYETVGQWEKRTGEKYPEDGPVWFKNTTPLSDFVWGVCRYITVKKDKDICVCISSPVPPPDDWELDA